MKEDEIIKLAEYKRRVSRGIVHTQKFMKEMRLLEEKFNKREN